MSIWQSKNYQIKKTLSTSKHNDCMIVKCFSFSNRRWTGRSVKFWVKDPLLGPVLMTAFNIVTCTATLLRPRQQSAPFHHNRLSNDTLSIARPNSLWAELQTTVGPLRKIRMTSNSLFHPRLQYPRTLHRDGVTNKNSRRDIGPTVLVCNQVTCQRPCMMSWQHSFFCKHDWRLKAYLIQMRCAHTEVRLCIVQLSCVCLWTTNKEGKMLVCNVHVMYDLSHVENWEYLQFFPSCATTCVLDFPRQNKTDVSSLRPRWDGQFGPGPVCNGLEPKWLRSVVVVRIFEHVLPYRKTTQLFLREFFPPWKFFNCFSRETWFKHFFTLLYNSFIRFAFTLNASQVHVIKKWRWFVKINVLHQFLPHGNRILLHFSLLNIIDVYR